MGKCDLLEALRTLAQKDTFPLHIWRVLLWGAAKVLEWNVNLLLTQTSKLLHLPRAAKSHHAIHPRKSSPSFFTPEFIRQYISSLGSQIAFYKPQLSLEIDMLDTKPIGTGEKMESFGPQNDFEMVLGREAGGDEESVRIVTPVRVDLPFNAGNETTIRKKSRKVADRTCCVHESYLKAWMAETSEITTWRMKAPPSSPSAVFLGLELKNVLESLESNQGGKIQMEGDEGHLNDGEDNFQLIPISDLGYDPEEPLEQKSEETQVKAIPPRAELVLPQWKEFSFEELHRMNAEVPRAAVFLRLLELTAAGSVVLVQEGEFAKLQIVLC